MRFEPAGLTNDADIRTAKSIVDYIFRWMGKKFLTPDQQEELGILSPEVREADGTLEQRVGGAYGGRRSSGSRGSGSARPDGALQRMGGRRGVRQVRRPHGANGQLLHLPRLRHQYRL
jgi:hypothetical protein